MWEFITNNVAEILLGLVAFADIIVSLTPSKRDDAYLGYFRLLLNAILNNNNKEKQKTV